MKEIRIHGRGGQGAVLAASLLALAFVIEGKSAGGFPHFATFEKRYSPVSSFVRFDEKEIREQMQVYSPDCVIVLDAGLVKAVDLFQGLRNGGMVVWCQANIPEGLALPQSASKVGLVDAPRIATDVLGARIYNTIMLGAFARTTGWVEPKSIVSAVRQKMAEDLVEKNVKAVMAGYEGARVVDRQEGQGT
ncbi:MAG: 2-oxoacid:acceptor oxidoreductase family protein [Chloroflexota bacterium]